MEGHCEPNLIPLLLVSILAFLIPILTSWFSKITKIPVPAVVGEIICGIIIGKSFLGIIESTDSIAWLDFLALFGFTYLMFLSGLEIDFGVIASESTASRLSINKKKIYRQPLFQALSYFAVSLILSSFVAYILYIQGLIKSWAMMTLILSTTSVSVVVPIIKEKMLSKTLLGQTILLSALSADFLTMVLITLVVALHTNVGGSGLFTLIFLVGILIFVVYRLHISKSFDKIVEILKFTQPFFSELAHATTQIRVRGAIALMVLFIVMSQILGFEVILGAFLAGILVTLLLGESKTHQLEMKLDAIGYGFFIPIFFISVGIDMDMRIFFESNDAWAVLIFLIISAFIIKIIPSFLFRFTFRWKEAISAGVLLSARLSLIIAASTIGLRDGLISEEVNAAVIMVAVITCIASPIAFGKLMKIKPEEERGVVAIVGARYVGRKLAKQLIALGKTVILAAQNDSEYKEAKKKGLPIIHFGENINETLLQFNMNKVQTVIATTEKDDFNLAVCQTARDVFSIKSLVSLVNDYDNRDIFIEQSIEPINKVHSVVENIVNKIIAPDGYAMFAGHEEDIKIGEVLVTNSDIDGMELKKIKLPGDTLVVHIKRGYEAIVPHGSTIININDHLTLCGTPESVSESIDLLGVKVELYCSLPKTSKKEQAPG